MKKVIPLSFACLGLILVSAVPAQKPEPLPEPPKPPAYLKKKLDSLKKAATKKATQKNSASELPSPEAAPAKESGKENAPKRRRSFRFRINIPGIGLHLNFNRGGNGDAPAANVDVTIGGKSLRPRMGHGKWRYRRHAGRWWYWLSKDQWAVFENGRWVEYLDKLKKSGEIRLGEPRRGKVRLKFGDLPGLNLGF